MQLAMRAAAVQAYQAVILADTPLAYWRCNEAAAAATLADTSGNGHTATIVSAVTTGGAGKNSRMGNMAAMSQTSYLTVANSVPFQITGDFSLSVWVRLATALTSGQVIHLASCAASGESLATNALYLVTLVNNSGTHQVQCFHESGAGTNHAVLVNVAYTATAWNHFAVTRETSTKTYRVYVNGALAGSNTYTTDPAGGTSGLYAFGVDAGQGTVSSVARDVDEIATFASLLSAQRVFEHYRAGRRAA